MAVQRSLAGSATRFKLVELVDFSALLTVPIGFRRRLDRFRPSVLFANQDPDAYHRFCPEVGIAVGHQAPQAHLVLCDANGT